MITAAFCRLKLQLLKEPHVSEWLTEAEIEDDKKRRSQEKNSLTVDSVLGSRKQSSHSRLFTRSPKVEESLFTLPPAPHTSFCLLPECTASLR